LADSSDSEVGNDYGDDDSDSDVEISMQDAVPGRWQAAERYAGIELKSNPPPKCHTTRQQVAVSGLFTAAKSFDGMRDGYVFRSGDHGTGYYLDQRTHQTKVVLSLHGQLFPDTDDQDRLADRPPA